MVFSARFGTQLGSLEPGIQDGSYGSSGALTLTGLATPLWGTQVSGFGSLVVSGLSTEMASYIALPCQGGIFVVDVTLIAHWTMDEGSGMVAYDSSPRHKHPMTLHYMDDSTWVPGVFQDALDFDGVTQYTDTDFSDMSGSQVYSIVLWANSAPLMSMSDDFWAFLDLDGDQEYTMTFQVRKSR